MLRSAIQAFARDEREELLRQLVSLVRQEDRATLKEAFIAGKVEACEILLDQLEQFAKTQLEQGS